MTSPASVEFGITTQPNSLQITSQNPDIQEPTLRVAKQMRNATSEADHNFIKMDV